MVEPDGSMLRVKVKGPSTELWGEPRLTVVCEEDSTLTGTNWNLADT